MRQTDHIPMSPANTRWLIVLFLPWLVAAFAAQPAPPNAPRYTSDGELMRPDNYREWIFLTAGLGMTYGTPNPERAPRFDNVFVNPEAYRSFVKTGAWPNQTIFILEIRKSTTEGSINQAGQFQEEVVTLEAHVKDEARFEKRWAFFNLGGSAASAKPLPVNSSCQVCHEAHGAVDETFVQFYPTLIPIAKAKGTYREPAGVPSAH